jgi:hypothetical protein
MTQAEVPVASQKGRLAMLEVHSVFPPGAIFPPGKANYSIGHRSASSSEGANGDSLPVALKPQTDSKPTPNETTVRKSDGSSAVEVTISLGAGKTSTYEKRPYTPETL